MTMVPQPRMTVVSAFAWKVIAELMRRHSHECVIELLEIHPGISVRGCLQLKITPHLHSAGASRIVTLNLGGPSGIVSIRHDDHGKLADEFDFLGSMLSEDPVVSIDRISRAMNLPVPSALPPSSTQSLVARLIAEVLGRKVLSRRMLRTSSAWFDASQGSRIATWLRHFGFDPVEQQRDLDSGAEPWESIQSAVTQYVALHDCAPDESTLLDHPPGNAVLFDMNSGRALLVTGKRQTMVLDAPLAYNKQGRRLIQLVDEIGSHV